MNITIPIPPSTNHAYGISAGRMYKTDKSRVWEREVLLTIPRITTIPGDVRMKISFFFVRDRDIDGPIKLILDILERKQYYYNDSQVISLNVTKYHVKDNPHVNIEIDP